MHVNSWFQELKTLEAMKSLEPRCYLKEVGHLVGAGVEEAAASQPVGQIVPQIVFVTCPSTVARNVKDTQLVQESGAMALLDKTMCIIDPLELVCRKNVKVLTTI